LLATTLWGALGATLAVVLAWALVWACRRPGPWRAIAAACVALGLAAPGPIAGLSLKLAYHAPTPPTEAPAVARILFAVQTSLHDTPAILVLAYAQRTLPYAVLVLWPAVGGLPREFLESALVDGYGRAGLVRRVALPLTRGPIAAAWAVAFVLALGELPASHLVLPPGHMTLSTRVWMLLHTGVESHLAGVGLILLTLYGLAGLGALWALDRFQRT
jgi:iron(III) transport system permease protein